MPATTGGIGDGRHREPLWARLALMVGILLITFSLAALSGALILDARYASGVHADGLLPPDDPTQPAELNREHPLNLLLVGVDARPDNNEPPRGDSIIIVHIPRGHTRAYLISLPRDLIVDIPASPPARNRPSREKLNGAFAYGAAAGRGIAGGVRLLSRAVSGVTGVTFDAAAVIDFVGFRAVVRELGGITMCLDHRIVSEHMGTGPDGGYLSPRDGGAPWVYEPGCQRLDDWHALDVVRQRTSLPDGDYGRQSNQQKFLAAVLTRAREQGITGDPRRMDAVLRAAGRALTFDGRGTSPITWAWSLRNLDAGSVMQVRTPGHGVTDDTGYRGEELDPVGRELISTLPGRHLPEFLIRHPDLVSSSS